MEIVSEAQALLELHELPVVEHLAPFVRLRVVEGHLELAGILWLQITIQNKNLLSLFCYDRVENWLREAVINCF